ncbi:type IV pilin protein [Noviherbaspirillum sp.]|uniref:type IV pilin protein n=1 Tax=Noviherbaspirillum sp. TaxID=1926288 RepID=UPI002FE0A5F9
MKKKVQGGFTLVEMAVVLVIIGLILGAISIGKDVQRNAEYQKVKQKFIDQWVVAYNAHTQRTGVVPGDSQVQPRLMVNGANYTVAANVEVSGGNMTAVTTASSPICNGAVGTGMTGTAQTGAAFNLRTIMQVAGVRMPPGRSEGQEDRYVYLDSNGNPQEIRVCFQWNPPGTASGSGNVMVISGLTPDLARSIDQMIDGKADSQEGMFRQQGVANGTPNAPGIEWNTNNTVAQGAAANAPTGRDEDQVITVVAHYKMNQ